MNSRHLDKDMAKSLFGLENQPGSRRAAAAFLDRRDAERVPLHTQASYVTDERMGLSRGHGRLEDLSKTGCKITGPVLMVGTCATLVLDFHDEKDPLCISRVTVTWSDGESFGVRFPDLKSEDRQRLQELVLRFATLRGSSQEHTAFRFRLGS